MPRQRLVSRTNLFEDESDSSSVATAKSVISTEQNKTTGKRPHGHPYNRTYKPRINRPVSVVTPPRKPREESYKEFLKYADKIKTQPRGRRMFCLKFAGKIVTNNKGEPVYFSKKSEAKEAKYVIVEKFNIETHVTKGPDHQEYKGE